MENKKPKNSTNPTSWEPVAGWYDDLLSGGASGDTYQAKVILPNLLRILPPKKSAGETVGVGRKILDIACGQGFFSHAYAVAGAEVLGVDISSELIKRARESISKTSLATVAKNPRFEVASASRVTVAKNESFDGAIIVLALQNIKEMAETLKEASRALVKGGTLVVVLNHPCFRVLKGSSWGFDESAAAKSGNGGMQYRRIDRYGSAFSVEVDMTPGEKLVAEKHHTVSFHRPLQDYFKALSSAGFGVVGLEEWISHKQSQRGPRAVAEDIARKEFPLFMAVVAKKL